LDTPHADYRDVALAITNHINSIQNDLNTHGKPMAMGYAAKGHLVSIYEGLKIKENWNLPMKAAIECK